LNSGRQGTESCVGMRKESQHETHASPSRSGCGRRLPWAWYRRRIDRRSHCQPCSKDDACPRPGDNGWIVVQLDKALPRLRFVGFLVELHGKQLVRSVTPERPDRPSEPNARVRQVRPPSARAGWGLRRLRRMPRLRARHGLRRRRPRPVTASPASGTGGSRNKREPRTPRSSDLRSACGCARLRTRRSRHVRLPVARAVSSQSMDGSGERRP
jgi:hypothetical protein